MALVYMFPVPDPIYVLPEDMPDGFEVPEEQLEKLKADAMDIDKMIRALRNHQIFTKQRGADQDDAILMALEERKLRRARDPDGIDYVAMPSAAAAILKICVEQPLFYQPIDDRYAWLSGHPFMPRYRRAYAPLFDCIAKPKNAKPDKRPALPAADADAPKSAPEAGLLDPVSPRDRAAS